MGNVTISSDGTAHPAILRKTSSTALAVIDRKSQTQCPKLVAPLLAIIS